MELSNKELEEYLASINNRKHLIEVALESAEWEIDEFTNRILDFEKEIQDLNWEIQRMTEHRKNYLWELEEAVNKIEEIEAEIARRQQEGITIHSYEELEEAGQIVFDFCV